MVAELCMHSLVMGWLGSRLLRYNIRLVKRKCHVRINLSAVAGLVPAGTYYASCPLHMPPLTL
jgi:hypothetical protein